MLKFARSSVLVSVTASAVLALVGCGSSEQPPTFSPTPIPTPTQPAVGDHDYFRVTSMAVGNASQGVDLNGDGRIDNGIEDALDEISTTIYDAIEKALTQTDTPPPTTILAMVEQILDAVLSVEAISEAINNPIESGDINYLMSFKESITGVTLLWNLGTFKNTGYAITQQLGVQEGSLESGAGLFGPGDLTLSLSFASPTGESSTDVELVLESGYTAISGYNGTLINNALSGGAVSIEFLMALAEDTLTSIQEALDSLPDDPNSGGSGSVVIPIDELLLELNAALVDQADMDMDLDGTGDAYSIGLIINADIVTIVQ